MSELEAAIRKAERFTKAGLPIPLDLAARLMGLGVDVDAIERNRA